MEIKKPMKKIIIFGVSIIALAAVGLYLAGCTAGSRENIRSASSYSLALSLQDSGKHREAWESFMEIDTDDPLFPSALIRAFDSAYIIKDQDSVSRTLDRLNSAVPLYPFLTDYLNYQTVKQMFYSGDYESVINYSEYIRAVTEEDLKKELLLLLASSLFKTGSTSEAFETLYPLFRRRLSSGLRSSLNSLAAEIVKKEPYVLHPNRHHVMKTLNMNRSEKRKVMKTAYDGTPSWWSAAVKVLRRSDLRNYKVEGNGYVIAESLQRLSLKKRVPRLKGYLEDPGVKYQEPLKILYLKSTVDVEYFLSHWDSLTAGEVEKIFRLYFREAVSTGDDEKTDALLQAGEDMELSRDARALVYYWRGRMLERLGEESENIRYYYKKAHELSPYGYYGVMSALRLGIDPYKGGMEKRAEGRKLPSLGRSVAALMEAGDEKGLLALQMALSDEDLLGNLDLFLQFYEKFEKMVWKDVTLSHLRTVFGNTRKLVSAQYAHPFGHVTSAASQVSSVPEYVIYAVMRQESRFHSNAESHAGAKGLMQLMEPTYRELRNRSPELTDDIKEVRNNIFAGSYYLGDLKDKFSDTAYALAAYNAGPHRVKRWISEYDPQDMDTFVEMIPFPETKDYVKQTMANIYIYKEICRGEESSWNTISTK